jgi:multidrug efflux pump subunit AcrB
VTAIYPGASAPVLESTVAAPLENAINGVEDMLYMNSTSSANGMVQIQVTFNIGTDIDKATLNVNNRAKQVEPRLPLEVRRQGLTVEKAPRPSCRWSRSIRPTVATKTSSSRTT